MIKADNLPCLSFQKFRYIFSSDSAILDHESDLSEIDFINTKIKTVWINKRWGIEYLTYNEFFTKIKDLDKDFFTSLMPRTAINLFSFPGTGKTLLCKKLVNDLSKRVADNFFVQMINTADLTSSGKLNLLIENAYSYGVLNELISKLDLTLQSYLNNNINDEKLKGTIQNWVKDFTGFLKYYIESRDKALFWDFKKEYEKIGVGLEKLRKHSEIHLEAIIKSIFVSSEIKIEENIVLDIINNYLEQARKKKLKNVLITLDDAVVGGLVGDESRFADEVFATIKDMTAQPLPEGIDNFMFIYGTTSPIKGTLKERSKRIELNYRWVNEKEQVLNYLKSKLNSILEVNNKCNKCLNKNCKRNIVEILFNDTFLSKWIEYEYLQKVKNEEDRKPRLINEYFGQILLDYFQKNNILESLENPFTFENSVISEIKDENTQIEALNIINLMYWFGEEEDNEYKINRDNIWIFMDEDELLKFFKLELIFEKDGYIYTSLNTSTISLENLKSEYIQNQTISFIPKLRNDLSQKTDGELLVEIKHENEASFSQIPENNGNYVITWNKEGNYILKCSFKFKENEEYISFIKKKIITIKNFPLSIIKPSQDQRFLPFKLTEVKISILDQNVDVFRLICEKDSKSILSELFTIEELIEESSDKKEISILWSKVIKDANEIGEYKLSIEYEGDIGSVVEFSILKSPITIKEEPIIDVDKKEIKITIEFFEDLNLTKEDFQVDIVKKKGI